jgi:hypothetical protein
LDEVAADLAQIEEVLENPDFDTGGKWIDHGPLMNYGMHELDSKWIARWIDHGELINYGRHELDSEWDIVTYIQPLLCKRPYVLHPAATLHAQHTVPDATQKRSDPISRYAGNHNITLYIALPPVYQVWQVSCAGLLTNNPMERTIQVNG